MRVLFVAPNLPWPLDAGGRIRSYQLLRELSKVHEISLWVVGSESTRDEHVAKIAQVTSEVRIFPPARRSLLGQLSGPVQEGWFYSKELEQELCSDKLAGQFDLIHLDELCQVRSLGRVPKVPAIIHHHKLDLELAQALRKEGASQELEVKRWRNMERQGASSALLHVFCCEEDANRFRERNPGVETVVVESGVDPVYFQAQGLVRETNQLLFLGSLDYEPNTRGLDHFLTLHWKAVRLAHPELELLIVGRGAKEECWKDPLQGVRWIGAVNDVRPWLAQATALLVPLEIGGGTRLKIVEAASMACPIISTEIGASGLGMRPEVHFFAAKQLSDLPRAIDCGLDSKENRELRAQAARRRTLDNYSWSKLAARLGGAWVQAAT
ncbi:MAG: glycosyltransferase involved in cell wall biosynthesis [Planctomycetota bacterium]